MDFTRVPESVIYKRKTIDKLASEHPFNATLIKHLMTIDGWEEVDPERVVAPCINTAYYMCTIMRMEYDASFRIQSYRYIARRGYVEGANSLQQCVILSIVALLIRHSTPEWRIKLEDIADNLYVYAMGLREIKTTYHGREIVCDLSLVPQIISRCIDESVVLPDELFQPRFIDYKVILDLKRNEVTFNWDKFISRYSDDEINELVASLGKTQIEKATLIKSMWIDIYNIRKELGFPMQPIFSQLQSAAKEFCPDYLESTGLFPSQSNNAAKESSSTTGKEETRIRELEEKLNKQEEENKRLKEEFEKAKQNITLVSDAPLKEEINRLKEERREMILNLLAPIVGKTGSPVELLELIEGRSNVEITDIVFDWVKQGRIPAKMKGRPLYRILHAAKIYDATESNWNTALCRY